MNNGVEDRMRCDIKSADTYAHIFMYGSFECRTDGRGIYYLLKSSCTMSICILLFTHFFINRLPYIAKVN